MKTVVNREPYKLRAAMLALLVHGGLFVLLYFGIAWQSQPGETISVELWQSLPTTRIAVPTPPPPPPPARQEVREVVPPQPEEIVKPEIVLPEKKKQPEPKPVAPKPVEPKPAPKKTARKKEAAEASQEEAVNLPSIVAQQAAEAAAAAQERVTETAKIRAARTAVVGREVDEYKAKIIQKIRHNIVIPPDVADDARAVFLVTVLPGGSVLPPRLSKSSGNAAYDSAVERAILKSQPLPLPANVEMFNRFRELELSFRPKE